MSKLGYPTELRAFLKSCGTTTQSVDPDVYNKPMCARVDDVLKTISNLMDKTDAKTSTDAQGSSHS